MKEVSVAELTEAKCKSLVGDLIYTAYVFNRDRSPDISVEGWKSVYGGKVYQYEGEYQAQKTRAKIDESAERISGLLDRFCKPEDKSFIKELIHTELLTLVIETRYRDR